MDHRSNMKRSRQICIKYVFCRDLCCLVSSSVSDWNLLPGIFNACSHRSNKLSNVSIELTSQSDLSTSRIYTLDSLKRNCIRVDTLDLESQKRSIISLCVAVLSQILFPQIYAMQQNPQLVISHDTDKYEKTSFVYLAHQSDCHGSNEHYNRLV